MDQLLEFITNHLVLCGLFVVILVLLIKNLLTDFTQGGSSIEASEATRLMNRENAILLDIRNQAEFSDGHIINATNIPFSEFENRASELEKLRDHPVIICCKTGSTARLAVSNLKKLGFEKIYHLKGGIESWKNADLPLTV